MQHHPRTIFPAFLAGTLAMLLLLTSQAHAAPAPLPGDADHDGDVDGDDMRIVIHNFGASNLMQQRARSATRRAALPGDLNADGRVNIEDLDMVLAHWTGPAPQRVAQPNIVMVYVDDMGYGDVAAFGADDLVTPNLDRMAQQGVKLTHCYNSSSACSTSRAALLTGCYHSRVSIHTVFPPSSNQGLNPDEITIAELLQGVDYDTAMVGKWHLGHPESLMPYNQGFEHFYGIPVSHDYKTVPGFNNRVPLYEKIPGQPVQVIDTIRWNDTGPKGEIQFYTQRFTQRAIDFIEQSRDQPFFLYVAYCMPHVALAATSPFNGVSKRGLYGDVMAEIDAGIGDILASLEDQGIAGDTVVVFASDNGPWLSYGNHSGSPGPLREGKRTVFDGGVRTPAIVYWPGQVPGMPCDAPVAVMDFYATFAAWAGAALPTDRTIDAVDLSPLLLRDTSAEDYDAQRPIALYDYRSRSLHAIRMGKWKLVFPHNYETVNNAGNDGAGGSYTFVATPLALFDMEADPGETTNLAGAFPAVVQALNAAADVIRADLGDNATGTPASDQVRPIGVDAGL
ncbi:MAG: sulfatase [Phycisphaerales bacterium JB063]